MASLPTQRTIKILKKHGWQVQVVEKFNQFAKVRQDLFGFIDLLAMRHGILLGIQACAAGDMPKRRDKALALPNLKLWLSTGNMFEVWGWSKKGARNQTKHWALDRIPIERFDMDPLTIDIPGSILRGSVMI